jgi:uncharacterized RDD family membrane protein YckC
MSYQNYSSEPTTDLFVDEPLIYAGFWDRFGAAFIDGIILIVPNLLFTYGIGPGIGDILSLATAWLYEALMTSGPGQATLGKRALGLKVVDSDGQRISFGQATGRHFGKILSTIILFIGYFMMLWDAKKQTLHDKMAATYVIKS